MGHRVSLKAFSKFTDTAEALQSATALVEELTQHTLNLDLAATYPNFVASPKAAPPSGGVTNAEYLAWMETWLTPEGDAEFDRFFAQYKAGCHGRGLACNDTSIRFDDCRSCTGACRVAFTCLQMDGTSQRAYEECVEQHEWSVHVASQHV